MGVDCSEIKEIDVWVMGEDLCSVWLSVVYEHDPMVGCNFVCDEDVSMTMIALVWSELLFDLSGVSDRVAILV